MKKSLKTHEGFKRGRQVLEMLYVELRQPAAFPLLTHMLLIVSLGTISCVLYCLLCKPFEKFC